MIRVLVVEDSPVVRDLLVYLLNSGPGLRVVGTARNGEEAVQFVRRTPVDIITMDIHMPKMDGFRATQRIMEATPTPVVIVSGSSDRGEVALTFRALEAGALAVIPRPHGIGHPEHENTAKELLQTVKLMSEVKVVRRWPRGASRSREAGPALSSAMPAPDERLATPVQVVAVGASTGGPVALQKILSRLPEGFSIPILIVQHMAPGFIHGFAEWLSSSAQVHVKVAEHGEAVQAGRAYVAGDGTQMAVTADSRIALAPRRPENGLCPSVSYLFRSVAKIFGNRAIAVLLSGMGTDGAAELKTFKDCGAVTIVQDKESSVVYGMPGEAERLGAATVALSPEKIAATLIAAHVRRQDKERLPVDSYGQR